MWEAEVTVQNIRTHSLITGIANALAMVIGTIAVLGLGIGTFGSACILILGLVGGHRHV